MTRKITCGGITYNSAKLFCEMNGIKYSKYFELKAKGYSPEEILSHINNKRVLSNSNTTNKDNINTEEKTIEVKDTKDDTVKEKDL